MPKASGQSYKQIRTAPPKRPPGRQINHQPNPAGPRTVPNAQGANKMAADLKSSPPKKGPARGSMKPQMVY